MCEQLNVLKKIRKTGKLNGFAVELAEAQAEDFMAFRKEFKTVMQKVVETQIKQGAQLDLVVKYINSPAEQERKDGIVWHEIKMALKSWKGWSIILIFIFALSLAGEKLWQLFGDKIQIG